MNERMNMFSAMLEPDNSKVPRSQTAPVGQHCYSDSDSSLEMQSRLANLNPLERSEEMMDLTQDIDDVSH